jgi:hypothetical protein
VSCVWMLRLILCGVGVSAAVAGCSSASSGTGSPAAPASANSGAASSNGTTYQLDSAVATLRFKADAATIDLTAQEGAQAISVTEQTRGATTKNEVSGSSAILTSSCPQGISFGDACRVNYTVTVPTRVALDIDGAAGDITLKGPLANAIVNTNAARITGTGLGAGTVQATTNAGQVDLSFAAAPTSVSVKTDAGEVTVTVPGAEKYNVTVSTTIGSENIAVDKDPSSQHRIDVTTTIGAVTIKKG